LASDKSYYTEFHRVAQRFAVLCINPKVLMRNYPSAIDIWMLVFENPLRNSARTQRKLSETQ
jgi:hypothetical protein